MGVLLAGCAHVQKSGGGGSPPPDSGAPPSGEVPPAPEQGAPAIEDEVLLDVQESLPKGWTLQLRGDALLIRRSEEVLVLQGIGEGDSEEAMASDTFDTPSERDFEERGEERTLEIIYVLEPRWSDEQIQAAHQENLKIGAELSRLAQRFNAGELYEDNKEARVERYERAYDALEAKLRPLPLCSTQQYSVFWDEAQELPDPDHGLWVWPEEALDEIDSVDRVLLSRCQTSELAPAPPPRRRSKKRHKGRKSKRKGKRKGKVKGKGKKRR